MTTPQVLPAPFIVVDDAADFGIVWSLGDLYAVEYLDEALCVLDHQGEIYTVRSDGSNYPARIDRSGAHVDAQWLRATWSASRARVRGRYQLLRPVPADSAALIQEIVTVLELEHPPARAGGKVTPAPWRLVNGGRHSAYRSLPELTRALLRHHPDTEAIVTDPYGSRYRPAITGPCGRWGLSRSTVLYHHIPTTTGPAHGE